MTQGFHYPWGFHNIALYWSMGGKETYFNGQSEKKYSR